MSLYKDIIFNTNTLEMKPLRECRLVINDKQFLIDTSKNGDFKVSSDILQMVKQGNDFKMRAEISSNRLDLTSHVEPNDISIAMRVFSDDIKILQTMFKERGQFNMLK